MSIDALVGLGEMVPTYGTCPPWDGSPFDHNVVPTSSILMGMKYCINSIDICNEDNQLLLVNLIFLTHLQAHIIWGNK